MTKFICDGCGKEAIGIYNPSTARAWPPKHWFHRTDAKQEQIACSHKCIEKVNKKSQRKGESQ